MTSLKSISRFINRSLKLSRVLKCAIRNQSEWQCIPIRGLEAALWAIAATGIWATFPTNRVNMNKKKWDFLFFSLFLLRKDYSYWVVGCERCIVVWIEVIFYRLEHGYFSAWSSTRSVKNVSYFWNCRIMRIDHLERVLGDFVVLWILYLGIKDRKKEVLLGV